MNKFIFETPCSFKNQGTETNDVFSRVHKNGVFKTQRFKDPLHRGG